MGSESPAHYVADQTRSFPARSGLSAKGVTVRLMDRQVETAFFLLPRSQSLRAPSLATSYDSVPTFRSSLLIRALEGLFLRIVQIFQFFCQINCTSRKKPGNAFKRGVRLVFPEIATWPVATSFLNKFYEDTRCGLYHVAKTGSGVGIWGGKGQTIFYEEKLDVIVINPHKLAPRVTRHFFGYVKRLRDTKETTLRKNFTKRFDHDHR